MDSDLVVVPDFAAQTLADGTRTLVANVTRTGVSLIYRVIPNISRVDGVEVEEVRKCTDQILQPVLVAIKAVRLDFEIRLQILGGRIPHVESHDFFFLRAFQ